MNGAFDLRMGESHIEVHKFRTGAILIATLLALVIQAWFPLHFARMALLDLPLLVTIYFGLSRRNPSTGLLLGTAIGLLQDSLSGPTVPLGLFGIAKTVIGYLDRKSTRLNSSHLVISYAVFCLKKKNTKIVQVRCTPHISYSADTITATLL